jgi:PPIC-type PPIASE domain/SurA N-terminal domain
LRDNRRRGLLIFAALLIALFAVVAIAQGIGRPDVPSNAIAVVEEVPGETRTVTDCHGDRVEDDPSTITRAEYDCALRQTAARAGLPRVPEPDDPQFADLREAAIGDLLDTAWIRGEASEQGITATEGEIDAQLEQIVSQNFRCPSGEDPFQCEEFRQFLERSSFSRSDVIQRVELQILSTELQSRITQDAPEVSADQIEDYYEDAPDQFTLPASRDIRLVLNRDRSKVEEAKSRLQSDDSDQSWARVARELSTDPVSKANGGLRQGLTEGLLEQPLNEAVFSASPGEIVGPVKTPIGFYVFQVEKVSPERTQALNQVQAQIRSQLTQSAEQEAFSSFVDDYGSRWQARTICAEDFLIERCSNFVGTGHPQNVSPACYEADPQGGRPQDCPAPVSQAAPALPGSVSVIAPQGQRLSQRPRPAGLQELPTPGLPGAVGSPTP